MIMDYMLNLVMFADAGTLTNATGNYVNSYTGATEAFSGVNTLTPGMKTYYDTELLENSRDELIYEQLGDGQNLPANHGMTVEWRKFNTLPDADKLTEGVIPTGKKLGQTVQTAQIDQYGEYVSVSDKLDLHHVDPVILKGLEELGAAGGRSYEKLIRAELMTGANVMMADAVTMATGVVASTPATRGAMRTANTATVKCYLTPDMVAKAVTWLQKMKAPYYEGRKYVAVIHPSVAYDLRKSKDWIEAHKYDASQEIFTGEIGELHGVRFIVNNMAPVVHDGESDQAVYQTMFFGKGAFKVVKPEGAGMETIIKTAKEIGGPLEQFSTIGIKFEMGCKLVYPERQVIVESCSSYSDVDEAN